MAPEVGAFIGDQADRAARERQVDEAAEPDFVAQMVKNVAEENLDDMSAKLRSSAGTLPFLLSSCRPLMAPVTGMVRIIL